MTITHLIYHISGRKVGCTKNLVNRKKRYRHAEGKFPEIEILEELYDKTDKEAGDIEWDWAGDWAVRLGYKRRQHYVNTIRTTRRPGSWIVKPKEEKIEAGRKGGYRRAQVLSPERLSELAKLAALSVNPQQRSENARRGGFRSAEVTSPEDKSKNARLGGLKTGQRKNGAQHQRGQCRYCGIITTLAVLARLHQSRCKKKPILPHR